MRHSYYGMLIQNQTVYQIIKIADDLE